MNDSGRGLCEEFLEDLEAGVLKPILELVKADKTLCLQIRNNYLNIYYRGGNILKIETSKDKYMAHFDSNYLSGEFLKEELPEKLDKTGIQKWLNSIPLLKHEMDLWFGKHPKNEREFQQLVVRENNYDETANSTDYYICDVEYTTPVGIFDMIGAYWPSSSHERKQTENIKLSFIEMKYYDKALKGSSGIIDHANKLKELISQKDFLAQFKKEMRKLFKQKRRLGLIDCKKDIESFSDEKPEFIFLLANHDPDSTILENVLNELSENSLFDIKFCVSNFMGYGLYQENIYSLKDFRNRFYDQI